VGCVPRGRGVLIAVESQPAEQPVNLGIGKREYLGPSPAVALALAVVVGALVFALIWKLRKTFGMKE
jgi:hypothetical protein